MNSLAPGYRALVVGAGGAIGGALQRALQADARCGGVMALGRRTQPALDLGDERSLAAAAQSVREALGGQPLHLVCIATGILQVPGRRPEKRLGELDAATLAQVLMVNAIGPALLVRHLHELLPLKERALLAVLSARVGSIGDNRLGGWYGYRASKAALNQLLHTAAIEVARKRPLAVLAALHPGTVVSPLSQPIIGQGPAHTPEQAAQHLLAVLDALPPEASGGFFAWDGTAIAW